jgi:hypothetical protein
MGICYTLVAMSLRRLTGLFSLLLMSHLLVAQSLFACSPHHHAGTHAGTRAGAAQHCHGAVGVAHAGDHPAHFTVGATHRTQPVPELPTCCTLAASCGSVGFVVAPRDATQRIELDVVVPAGPSETPLARPTAPEPPPPKQLGH